MSIQKSLDRFDTNVFWKVIFKNLTPETQAFIRNDYQQELGKAREDTLEEVLTELKEFLGQENDCEEPGDLLEVAIEAIEKLKERKK